MACSRIRDVARAVTWSCSRTRDVAVARISDQETSETGSVDLSIKWTDCLVDSIVVWAGSIILIKLT